MSEFASWDASSALSAAWVAAAGPGAPRACAAGTLIFAQGDVDPRFYLLHAGFVQASIARPDGEFLLLEIFGPGTLFGEGAAFDGLPRYVTTTAVTDCTLGVYEAREVRERIAQQPALALELIRIMSAKQRSLATKVAGLSGTVPEQRVTELLRRVARLHGGARGSGGRVQLTHDEIAAMTGLSRVTVTRALKQLSDQGLIATRRGRIDIPQGSAVLD